MPVVYLDETDPKLRERVARIVKLRLSQQYDLDIPGIEKYKKPEFKPQIKVPDLDETSVMEVAGADRASGTVEGAVGSTTEVTQNLVLPSLSTVNVHIYVFVCSCCR